MSAILLPAHTMCRACGWQAESLGGAEWAGAMRMCLHARVQSNMVLLQSDEAEHELSGCGWCRWSSTKCDDRILRC